MMLSSFIKENKNVANKLTRIEITIPSLCVLIIHLYESSSIDIQSSDTHTHTFQTFKMVATKNHILLG